MFSRTLCRRISRTPAPNALPAISTTTAFPLVRRAGRVASRPTQRCQSYLCRRTLTTPAPQTSASELPMDQYHALSEATMTTLLEQLEDLLDALGSNDMEVDYHGGVLTLGLGLAGTYVVNKQPPNQQIWLSSPISGPKRYDYVPTSDDWRYSRDGEELGALLGRELSDTLGRKISLKLGCVSTLA